jgi:hypothetical protein
MNTDLLNDYQTSHLPLAAFLSIKGCQIKVIENVSNRGVFHFAFVPRFLINDFNNGAGTVEPGAFALKMNQLIQSAKRNTYERA